MTDEEVRRELHALVGMAGGTIRLADLPAIEREELRLKAGAKDKLAGRIFSISIDRDWQGAICRMVERVLTVPLDSGPKDLILSRIGKKDRLSELEFYFPLQSITPQKLQGIFSGYGGLSFSREFPV